MKLNLLKKLMIIPCMAIILLVGGGTSGAKTEVKNDTYNKIVTVTGVRGDIEIPADLQRIVDLSSNSDILSILGYDVVGTANSDVYDYTKFPSYLEKTLNRAEILGYSMQDTIDVEAIMNLNTDLIVISTVQEKMYDKLSEIASIVMI